MLLAGSTRYLRQPVQSGDSPEGKTPPPWGVLCSQRGVDQLWAERVPGGLRECVTRQAGGSGRCGVVWCGVLREVWCGVVCSDRCGVVWSGRCGVVREVCSGRCGVLRGGWCGVVREVWCAEVA